jgi:hypothetical protein
MLSLVSNWDESLLCLPYDKATSSTTPTATTTTTTASMAIRGKTVADNDNDKDNDKDDDEHHHHRHNHQKQPELKYDALSHHSVLLHNKMQYLQYFLAHAISLVVKKRKRRRRTSQLCVVDRLSDKRVDKFNKVQMWKHAVLSISTGLWLTPWGGIINHTSTIPRQTFDHTIDAIQWVERFGLIEERAYLVLKLHSLHRSQPTKTK